MQLVFYCTKILNGNYIMNKTELTDAVASKAGLSKSDAGKALDAVFEAITETLSRKDTVAVIGFGTFSVSARAARTGRNPRTGETIHIAASSVPKFKPGKSLKEAVN